MEKIITIPNRLTSLNKYINAERTNRYKAAAIKAKETELVYFLAKSQRVKKLPNRPLDFVFLWKIRNRRTDPDNIAFACKFIFDGLVLANVLKNDGHKQIRSISHRYEKSSKDSVVVFVKSENLIEEYKK